MMLPLLVTLIYFAGMAGSIVYLMEVYPARAPWWATFHIVFWPLWLIGRAVYKAHGGLW